MQVMGVIEGDVETRVRRTERSRTAPATGWPVAGFMHTTARPVDGKPPDPHPHWHMFCFNATRDAEEGRIKAADFANIYRDRAFYEALFFSLVAQDFRRMGLCHRTPRERQMGHGRAGVVRRHLLQTYR